MLTRTLLVILTTFNAVSTYNCFGMEIAKENEIIPLNNGLLTIIPGILSKTGYRGWLSNTRIIYDSSQKKDSLINLLYYKKQLSNDKGANDFEIFCPLTIRESNGLMENLGQFDETTHREALEAIRFGKAIYYAQEQGALIYSLDKQPNPIVCKSLNNTLENAKNNDIKLPQYLLK
jgi:hypothetical protein